MSLAPSPGCLARLLALGFLLSWARLPAADAPELAPDVGYLRVHSVELEQ